jgi:hypothetical protein
MIPKPEKCTKEHKMVKKIPNVRKIFQMAIKNVHFSNLTPSKIFPNWNFWFENKPSGNPVWLQEKNLLKKKLRKSNT